MAEAKLSMAQTIRFLESKQGFSLPLGNHAVMVEEGPKRMAIPGSA
jgi:hypothetical protein